MITTDFTGNFGNHIFQYLVLRSVAERKGYDWGCTRQIFGDYHGGADQMDFLNIDYGLPVSDILYEYSERYSIVDNARIHGYHKFNDLNDNTKLVGCWQNYNYINAADCKKWLTLKNEDELDATYNLENTCIINVRGGEYKCHPELILPASYWRDAIWYVRSVFPKIEFRCITDDVEYAKKIMPLDIPCRHYSIEVDYYLINKAECVIMSNSSFALIPVLGSKTNAITIAPKYWSRFNTSDGYWTPGNIINNNFLYLDRDGYFFGGPECLKELTESKYWSYYGC